MMLSYSDAPVQVGSGSGSFSLLPSPVGGCDCDTAPIDADSHWNSSLEAEALQRQRVSPCRQLGQLRGVRVGSDADGEHVDALGGL